MAKDEKNQRADAAADEPDGGLPRELAQPARRALTAAGYTRLEQLASASEAEIRALHGMGPKALEQLRRALAAEGLSFAPPGRNRREPE